MTHPIALAERRRILAYIEARAAKVERHGGKASARQLRVAAGDIEAGMHREGGDGR